MEVSLTVYGTVRGKQRHVVTRTGHRYTPQQTVRYEKIVACLYKSKYGNVFYGKGVQVGIEINAYFKIPESDSKKTKKLKESNEIRPVKKPDADNIAKIIKDALNGVAYYDDAQVVEEKIYKWFGDKERVEIRLYSVG